MEEEEEEESEECSPGGSDSFFVGVNVRYAVFKDCVEKSRNLGEKVCVFIICGIGTLSKDDAASGFFISKIISLVCFFSFFAITISTRFSYNCG